MVEGDEAVGKDDALDRGMRNVALVPERVVLECGTGICAQQSRKAHNLFAANRIPLVRHRRGTFLALRERFFDLANLGFLETTNLERALLESGTRNRQRRQ